MLPPTSELKTLALAAVGIMALIGLLETVILKVAKLEPLQFGHGKVFATIGEVGGLAAFLAVPALRAWLPSLPGAWIWIGLSLVPTAIAFGLALHRPRRKPSMVKVLGGLVCYTLAVALFVFGVVKAAAEAEWFYTLQGRVTSGDRPLVDARVEAIGETGLSLRTSTDEDGEFTYLLYRREAEDVYQVQVDGGKPRVVLWSPKDSRIHSLRIDLERPDEEASR